MKETAVSKIRVGGFLGKKTLVEAIGAAQPGDIILLPAGKHVLTDTITLTRGPLTIRGTAESCNDVIIEGDSFVVKNTQLTLEALDQ